MWPVLCCADMERGSGSVTCVSLALLALPGEWSAPASFCVEVDVAAYMCASVGFTQCVSYSLLSALRGALGEP